VFVSCCWVGRGGGARGFAISALDEPAVLPGRSAFASETEPARGGDVLDGLGDFDLPRVEVSAVEVPMADDDDVVDMVGLKVARYDLGGEGGLQRRWSAGRSKW